MMSMLVPDLTGARKGVQRARRVITEDASVFDRHVTGDRILLRWRPG
jgi:hypothetical protein